MLTLARAARASRGVLVAAEVIEAGLALMGDRANAPLDAEPREARAVLVSQFVRRLRGIRVEVAHDLERVLLAELHAAPDGTQDVLIKDAISVIRARNHLGQLAKSLGMSWAETMKLEAALGDVLRWTAGGGGGVLQTTTARDHARITLKIALDGREPDLALLAGFEGVPGVATEVQPRRVGHHLTVEMTVERRPQVGAA